MGKLFTDYTTIPPTADPVVLGVEAQMARQWFDFCQGTANAQGILQAGNYFQETVRGIRGLVAPAM